jgi:hypothetical protein
VGNAEALSNGSVMSTALSATAPIFSARQGDVGEHVMLSLVHQRSELGPARPKLVGEVTPSLTGGLTIELDEGLADGGGDHGVLPLGHMRQAFLMKWTRQRCHVAPTTRVIAAVSPS